MGDWPRPSWNDAAATPAAPASAHACDPGAYSTTPVASSASSSAIHTVTELRSSGTKFAEM